MSGYIEVKKAVSSYLLPAVSGTSRINQKYSSFNVSRSYTEEMRVIRAEHDSSSE